MQSRNLSKRVCSLSRTYTIFCGSTPSWYCSRSTAKMTLFGCRTWLHSSQILVCNSCRLSLEWRYCLFDGWMDRSMDGWVHGWMNGWMDKSMDGWMGIVCVDLVYIYVVFGVMIYDLKRWYADDHICMLPIEFSRSVSDFIHALSTYIHWLTTCIDWLDIVTD